MPAMSRLNLARMSLASLVVALAGVAGAVAFQPAEKQPAGQPPASHSSVQRTAKAVSIDPMDPNRYGMKVPVGRVPGEVRIATYNLENLFDDKDDPNLKGKNEDKDQTKPKANCEALAKAIHAINADILAVEEIESKEALLWFRDGYLKDMGYQYVSAIDAGDERGIEQGVLSRFPITKEMNWPKADLGAVGPAGTTMAGQTLQLHRSPLRVDIQVPPTGKATKPYNLTLFVVHQKSGKDFGWFRELESKKFLGYVAEVREADPNANIVILGDFNAIATDDSFKTYLTAGLIDPYKGKDLGKDPRYITHASGRCIDHILISRSMSEEIDADTRFVLSTPILPEGADFRLAKELPGYASDHFPVVLDIKPVDSTEPAPAAAQPEQKPASK